MMAPAIDSTFSSALWSKTLKRTKSSDYRNNDLATNPNGGTSSFFDQVWRVGLVSDRLEQVRSRAWAWWVSLSHRPPSLHLRWLHSGPSSGLGQAAYYSP
jgi:hypothetical protein